MSKSGWPWNQGHVYEIRGIPMKSGAPRCPWFQGQSTCNQGVPDFRGSLDVNMVSLNSGAVTKINTLSLHSGAVFIDHLKSFTAWQLESLTAVSLTGWQCVSHNQKLSFAGSFYLGNELSLQLTLMIRGNIGQLLSIWWKLTLKFLLTLEHLRFWSVN